MSKISKTCLNLCWKLWKFIDFLNLKKKFMQHKIVSKFTINSAPCPYCYGIELDLSQLDLKRNKRPKIHSFNFFFIWHVIKISVNFLWIWFEKCKEKWIFSVPWLSPYNSARVSHDYHIYVLSYINRIYNIKKSFKRQGRPNRMEILLELRILIFEYS
jgi:hypothetical protein